MPDVPYKINPFISHFERGEAGELNRHVIVCISIFANTITFYNQGWYSRNLVSFCHNYHKIIKMIIISTSDTHVTLLTSFIFISKGPM